MHSQLFDAYYFSQGCGSPYGRTPEFLAFFDNIAARIVSDIHPATVLDAGCAWGLLVEALRKRSVEAYGIDISEYAISQVHPEVRPYCMVGSVTDPFPRRYDLVVSIEVLEHMPPDAAGAALANLCQATDDVLFSSTPFDYKEATHLNVQPPEVWSEMFARHAFVRDVDFDASMITEWAVRYRKTQEPFHRLVRNYERKYWLLHKENSDLRQLALEMRQQLSASSQKGDAASADKDQQILRLTGELQEIYNSFSWRLVKSFQRVRLAIAPLGSPQDRLLVSIKRKLFH